MAYSRKVGVDNPSLIVFVLDQSGSMAADWPGSQLPQPVAKAEALADILNGAIRDIGARCVRANDISPRYDIAIIGYGDTVSSQWGGMLAGQSIVNIKGVVSNPLGIEKRQIQLSDGRGGLIDVDKQIMYWIEAKAGGGTPMGRAMAEAHRLIEQWLREPLHQRSFPPVVIHITDGMPQDEPLAMREAESIRQLRTDDGNVLIINIHLPECISYLVAFPVSASDLPPGDKPANLLFGMSSTLPDEMLESALNSMLPVKANCKLMIANAEVKIVIRLIK